MRKCQFTIGLIGFCIVCALATITYLHNVSLRNDKLAEIRIGHLRNCRTLDEVYKEMEDLTPLSVQAATINWRIGDNYLCVEFHSPSIGEQNDTETRVRRIFAIRNKAPWLDAVRYHLYKLGIW